MSEIEDKWSILWSHLSRFDQKTIASALKSYPNNNVVGRDRSKVADNYALGMITRLNEENVNYLIQKDAYIAAQVTVQMAKMDEFRAEIERLNLTQKDRYQVPLINGIARGGYCQVFRKYIGLNPEVVKAVDDQGNTALHIACQHGHFPDAALLVDAGADVLQTNKTKWTSLHCAAASVRPNPSIAHLLVGIYLQQTTKDRQLLMDQNGNTPLHLAAKNKHITSEFIQHLGQLDPTLPNSGGLTAFHAAAYSSNNDTMQYMLETFAPTDKGWDMDDIEIEQ